MKLEIKLLICSLFFVLILVSGNFFIKVVFSSGTSVCEPSQDAYVASQFPTQNTGSIATASIGKTGAYFYRFLIDFNVTDLVEKYQYGIVNDEINIRFYGALGGASQPTSFPFEVYRIMEEWNSSEVTWDTQPEYSSENVSYDVNTIIYNDYEFCYIDIANDFFDVLANNGTDFYGYMIRSPNWITETQVFTTYQSEAGSYFIPCVFYGDTGESEAEDEGIIGDVTGDFLANWFIYAIFLVVLPISMTVYISNLGENVSPSLMLITFMGSETLMTAISLSIGLVNVWFMLIVIIVDVMIIFGLLKGRD